MSLTCLFPGPSQPFLFPFSSLSWVLIRPAVLVCILGWWQQWWWWWLSSQCRQCPGALFKHWQDYISINRSFNMASAGIEIRLRSWLSGIFGSHYGPLFSYPFHGKAMSFPCQLNNCPILWGRQEAEPAPLASLPTCLIRVRRDGWLHIKCVKGNRKLNVFL